MMRILAVLLLCAMVSPATAKPLLNPVSGTQVDLSLTFTDAQGARRSLANFTAGKPSLVLLGYHRCPNLCGLAQVGLAQALAATGLRPSSYSVVFATIDPAETPADALEAQRKLMSAASKADVGAWHFLVGGRSEIAALERALGQQPERIRDDQAFAHPVAISALTPDGHLSRVLSGLDPSARDLRLAVIEASQGRLGSLGERLALFCSGFNPLTGHYDSAALLALRLASLATMAAMAGMIFMLRRSKTR